MPAYAWFVGIDLGSAVHQVCLMNADRSRHVDRRVTHDAASVQEVLTWIVAEAGVAPSAIAVAVEAPRGALIDAALERGLAVFAINPKPLDRFRDRHTAAGAKDDRRDALVLGDSLRTDPQAFHAVRPDHPVIVQLRAWAQVEADLDREQRVLTNRLREQLYRTAPTVLDVCPAADEPWLWTLLERAPSPMLQAKLSAAWLGRLLQDHRVRRLHAGDLHARLQAPRFPLAAGTIEASVTHMSLLLPRLRLIHTQLRACAQQTAALVQTLREQPEADAEPREHHDIAILESLPGVGRKTTVAMLTEAGQPLADRAYQTLRALMGLAPVTRASGKRKTVVMRYACRHGLRPAAYHWGRVAAQRDPASKTYYAQLRARGHSHGRALRSVVDRLLRILIAMLRSRSLYDPTRCCTPERA